MLTTYGEDLIMWDNQKRKLYIILCKRFQFICISSVLLMKLYISKTCTETESQWRVTTGHIAVKGRPRALLTSIRNPVVVHFSWSYWLTKITWRCHCHQLLGPAPTPTPNSLLWVSLSLPWPVSSLLCSNMQILFYNDNILGKSSAHNIIGFSVGQWHQIPGARIRGNYALPDMGAGNGTLVFCNSLIHS